MILSMATEQTQKLVTITSKAAEKIQEFMAEEEGKPQFLRIYVQGGGCSCLLYTSPSPRDLSTSRMPSSA